MHVITLEQLLFINEFAKNNRFAFIAISCTFILDTIDESSANLQQNPMTDEKIRETFDDSLEKTDQPYLFLEYNSFVQFFLKANHYYCSYPNY